MILGRSLALAVSAALFAVSPSFAALDWNGVESVPGRAPVVVKVAGHDRHYFRVTPREPLALTIQGPAKVRVVSRAEFAKGSRGVQTYRLRAMEGGKIIEELSTESSASEQVETGEGEQAGKGRKLTFEVGEGSHNISLALDGAPAVLVRVRVAGKRPAVGMVSLTPTDAARSLLLAEGEKTIPYYELTSAKPVRLRVIGPVSLDLVSRLCFDATMRGSLGYRITVTDGGRKVRDLVYTASKATTASFTNGRDLVPSKMDRVVLPLGAGTHELVFTLVEPARGSAVVHARIPAPTTGNEE